MGIGSATKVAGIDMGAVTTKVVVLCDGEIIAKGTIRSSEEGEVQARRAVSEVLDKAGLKIDDLDSIVATGTNRKYVSFADAQRTSPICIAKGALFLLPQARTIIDVGGESCVTLRVSEQGMVEQTVANDRCASGSGVFLEAMAKLMRMPLAEMAKESLTATARATVSSMCAIFAEQEVISLIHRKPPTPRPEIVAGIYESMATRVVGFVRRVGVKEQVLLCGGVAKNVGFARILGEALGTKLNICDEPEMVGAIGAALFGLEAKAQAA